MNQFLLKLQTASSLGIVSLWKVFNYKIGINIKLNPVHKLKSIDIAGSDFFYLPEKNRSDGIDPNVDWINHHSYFSWFRYKSKCPPNWHQNPFNKSIVSCADKNWWEIPDFSPELGDIKTVWEASRFDWVLGLSQSAVLGDKQALETLNLWLNNWCEHNPTYKGANWKCGQEASIRVMHLCIAASILNQQASPTDLLVKLVKAHLKRIAPTIGYAIAQNNNHGTSEAAALYMGGSWLYGLGNKSALKYQKLGLKWLENCAKRLISNEGAFSQYSVTYHRVMLDTYSMAEYWRNLLDLPAFSSDLYHKLNAATNWLYQMTQIETGDAPNLGANDGARLLPLTSANYRDFRPSVQLASVLFNQKRAYKIKGTWDSPLQWLNIDLPKKWRADTATSDFSASGYSLLRNTNTFLLFTIPRYKFRPSQSDALHIDFWLNGENLLRDGGTYSYNTTDEDIQYFSGTASHNTVQFDDRDQMPRISRFLLGAWLNAKEIIPVTVDNNGSLYTAAAYEDYYGAYHHRSVKLTKNNLTVIDTIKRFQKKAIIRWRLNPSNWVLNHKDKIISNNKHSVKISSQSNIVRFEIIEGWESRYYLQKTSLPVLEIELDQASVLTTEYIYN